jgi:hypothetical protein
MGVAYYYATNFARGFSALSGHPKSGLLSGSCAAARMILVTGILINENEQ